MSGEPIGALWIGYRLSVMEQLAIRSYQRQGHPVHLYLYGPCEGIPEGTVVKDARKILPESAIGRFHCLANFSDLFRWTLLYKRGGWWADLDTVAVRPMPSGNPYVFSDGDCGKGKALSLDTPVPTPDGWTTMGKVITGDIVFGDDGQPCRVTRAHEILHGEQCYLVRFSDGSEIIADAGHQWKTLDVRTRLSQRRYPSLGKEAGLVTTQQMAERVRCGRENNHAIGLCQPLQLPARNLPIHPYALGYWLGDGNSADATVTIGKRDQEEMSAIFLSLGISIRQCTYNKERFVLGGAERRRSITTGRMMSNESLNSKLRAAGLLGNKHIPLDYLRASIAQRTDILSGLLDSDGYCSPVGQVEFSTTNPRLAEGTYELAVSLGFKPTIKTARAMLNGKDYGIKFRLRWTPHTPTFRMQRKRQFQNFNRTQRERNFRRYVVSVTPIESVPVRCLTVDSRSHLYLVGRAMIPTHNSRVGAGNMRLPRGSKLAEWAIRTISKMDAKGEKDFSAFGPTLLMKGINKFSLHRYILPCWAFLPIDAWSAHRIAEEDIPISPDTYAIHLYNNIWSFRRIDKDGTFPYLSLYEKLKRLIFGGSGRLTHTRPRNNALIAVVSCDGKRGWAEAQYETWCQTARAEGYDVVFFDGENLGVSDSPYIPAITEKAAAIYRWSLEHGYSHTLKCDDDCYLDARRLKLPRVHYTGIPCGPNDGGKAEYGFPDYAPGTHPHVFASGGAAWFSKDALRFLVRHLPITGDWTDDRWAGQVLAKQGFRFFRAKGFYWWPDVPKDGDDIVAMTQLPTINAIYDMHLKKRARLWLDPDKGLPAPLVSSVEKALKTTGLVASDRGLESLAARLHCLGAR